MKKNHLKLGIKSNTKIQKSFYLFLYKKHLDWAIIFASFFGALPYVGSKVYFIFTVKIILFALIMYFCIRYILIWKQLYDYYKEYKKAIKEIKILATQSDINKIDNDKISIFLSDLKDSIMKLKMAYEESLSKSLSFDEFLTDNEEIAKPLLYTLNKDIKLTSTIIGNSIGALTIIFHIRGIPKIELENYHRLITIILLLIIFFAVYALEISVVQ